MSNHRDTARVAARLTGIAIALFAAACGGSSSETPWPEEPVRRIDEPGSEGGLPRDEGAGADGGTTEPEPAQPRAPTGSQSP
jgi:hypothetical protein